MMLENDISTSKMGQVVCYEPEYFKYVVNIIYKNFINIIPHPTSKKVLNVYLDLLFSNKYTKSYFTESHVFLV